jgi:LacI family gluconate utilization system Gnt-I transcriptional repressor
MSGKNRSISSTRRVTLKEIAGKFEVDIMTVSRALNRPHLVAEPLRQRILDEVERTGYVPNRAASGLASGGVPLIPVIVPTLQHSVYVSLLDGLHSVLPKAGFEILIRIPATGFHRSKHGFETAASVKICGRFDFSVAV